MAAPHVSGVASLIIAHTPSLNNNEVYQILKASADDLGDVGFDSQTGYGRVNAQRALEVQSVPRVQISEPTSNTIFNLQNTYSISIKGTAAGKEFKNYQLFYGIGRLPQQWNPISDVISIPVENGDLGLWRIDNPLETGYYAIKLVVTTQSNFTFQDVVIIPIEKYISTQISLSPYNESKPVIFQDKIAWVKYHTYDKPDIYMYDLKTKTENQITSNPASQYSVYLSDDKVFWTDDRNGNQDIYYYDLSTNTEHPLITNTGNQYLTGASGSKIVYHDDRNGNFDVYLYDLTTNSERQITSDPSNQQFPSISGDKIVWEDQRNANGDLYKSDIYLYDLTSNSETQITIGPKSLQYYNPKRPRISGNNIVWDSNFEIFLYDLTSRMEYQITNNTAIQWKADVSGNRVVWEDWREGNRTVYTCIYNQAAESCPEERITFFPSWQRFPSVWNNQIVWVDNRNGNYDIYLMVLTTPFVCTACSADVNMDGYVNTGDFSLLKSCSGKEPLDMCSASDINQDGVIDLTNDYQCWQSQLGQQCSENKGLGYWKMDEPSWTNDCSTKSVIDSSGNNSGMVCPSGAGPLPQARGMFSGAGKFSDGNYINVNSTLNPTSALSLSAWVKIEKTDTSPHVIVSKWDWGNSQRSYQLQHMATNSTLWPDKIVFSISKDGLSTLNTSAVTAFSTTTASSLVGKWAHLVGTYDSQTGTAKLYINGVEQGSSSFTSLPAPIFSSSANLLFGANSGNGTAGSWFNGLLDDVKLYDRLLTAQEVATLYNLRTTLVGYWNLNETSPNTCSGGVNDSCDKGLSAADGAWNGNITTTAGKFGNGLSFDGNSSYVLVPHNPELNPTSQMTLSAWVKVNQTDTNPHVIVSKWDWGNSQRSYQLQHMATNSTLWPDKIVFSISKDGLSTLNTSAITAFSTTTASSVKDANTWIHLVGVYDGQTAKLYVNGVEEGSTSFSSPQSIFSSSTPLFFGTNSNNTAPAGAWFNGGLDEVRIYDTALSAADVSKLFQLTP